MPSVSSRFLGLAVSAVGHRLGYRDLDEVRRKVERQRTRPAHFGPPKKLQKTCMIRLSFEHGWPCYEIVPRERTPVAQVLYLHGGAYIEEVGFNHWALVMELADNVPARVVVPVYPLAPAGTAQTVLPELTELARGLTSGAFGVSGASGASEPSEPSESSGSSGSSGPGLPTVFAGDSAGSGLSLAAAQRLRDGGEPTPDRLVLISPWLDAALDEPLVDEIQPHDPMLAVEPLRWAGELWAGGLPLSDPSVSPLNGDMAGLPPAQVFTGSRDILLADARRFRDRAAAAGVSVEMHEEAGQIHAYPLWPVAEGRKAREQILAGIRRSAGAV